MAESSADHSHAQGETADAPRIALAHDWLVGMRGGEWVLDALAQLYGPTDLYTLVSDGRPLTDAIAQCTVHTSMLQKLPGASGKLRRHYLPLMPWVVGRIRVQPCDLLISTSSAVMKSIRPPENVPHLCYCHSPARYIWEQMSDYASGSGGSLRAAGLRAVRRPFQQWDRATASRVTQFVTNSQHTAERIRRCYNRDAIVVYPPVRTELFTPSESVQREEWYLVVSALEPYKRTDLVIDAANRSGFQLRIAGSGSQLTALRQAAGPNVKLLGRVDDAALLDLYRRARALIFPQMEDFGIIPVEAQATGCPVIALAAGGALETVTTSTGIFFTDQSADAIADAVKQFEASTFDADACHQHAWKFRRAVFNKAIRTIVDGLLDERTAASSAQISA